MSEGTRQIYSSLHPKAPMFQTALNTLLSLHTHSLHILYIPSSLHVCLLHILSSFIKYSVTNMRLMNG